MKVKHQLDGGTVAQHLSSIALFQKAMENLFYNADGGFTMALTGPWGCGKTTFVQNWIPALRDKGFKVIYLNAWESDFVASPIACLIGELKIALGDLINEQDLADLAEHLLLDDLKVNGKTKDSTLNALSSVEGISIRDEITEYDKLRLTLVRFRELMTASVKDSKVVFFIDELDRCRPDYAVRMLEIVKHFFTVNGVIFVAVIDKNHLCESIKGFYGSSSFDASDYLRRFFEIEVQLPTPSYKDYCKYLCEYYGISNVLNSPFRARILDLKDDLEVFLNTTVCLAEGKHLTFRQLEHLMSYMRVILLSVDENEYIFPDVLILLLYLRQFDPGLYTSLSSGSISVKETLESFESIFSELFTLSSKTRNHFFEYTFVCFLRFYENYSSSGTTWGVVRSSIYDTVNKKMLIPCSRVTEKRMIELLDYYEKHLDSVNMGNIFKKISLLQNH